MFTMKMLDGSQPSDEYLEQISRMVSNACVAEEVFGLDELELFNPNPEFASNACVATQLFTEGELEESLLLQIEDNLRSFEH
jgi:hypothetical protein